jgi:hypothetical protein
LLSEAWPGYTRQDHDFAILVHDQELF